MNDAEPYDNANMLPVAIIHII
uniref:Uncharacterized protein n=1 Tax=Rhizophora mucronata TaxID=61149 RepID=A0A2P2QV09_RHIMU